MDQSLAQLEAELHSVDLSVCDSAELRRLSGEIIAGQRLLDGHLLRATQAARLLEDTGHGSTAEDTIRGSGAVSTKTAKRLNDRADVAELLPGVGETIGVRHLCGSSAGVAVVGKGV